MTLRTKSDPLISRALSITKLDRMKYAHFLFMFLPETLQLLLGLLLIKALTFKLRCKATILFLQGLYLRFHVRQTIKRKRKAFTNYVRDRDFFQSVPSHLKDAHMIAPLPNVQAHRELPNRVLSAFAEPQPGSDAVARIVRQRLNQS